MVDFPENFTSKRPTPLEISQKSHDVRAPYNMEMGAQMSWESLGYNFQPKFEIIMIRPTKLYLGGCVHGQYHIPNHLGWLGGPWTMVGTMPPISKISGFFWLARNIEQSFIWMKGSLHELFSHRTIPLVPDTRSPPLQHLHFDQICFNFSQWCFWARGDTGRSNSGVAKLTILHFSVQIFKSWNGRPSAGIVTHDSHFFAQKSI